MREAMVEERPFDDCAECGAPLEVYHAWPMKAAGPGPRGAESLVVMERVRCAANHHYVRERRPDA